MKLYYERCVRQLLSLCASIIVYISSKLESVSKQDWEKLYSKDTIPSVAFLALKNQNNLRSISIDKNGYELTNDRNLLNNPSRLRHLSRKVKRRIDGRDVLEEPNYQFIVKIKDGSSIENTFIRENNVLSANIYSVVTTASHVTEIVNNNEIEWIGEYESRFKSTFDFQKLQSLAFERKRTPPKRSLRNVSNSTRISQTFEQSNLIRFVISVIPSVQSITLGTQQQETEKLVNEINTILSKKYVKDVDFAPMILVSENVCEIAFSPFIASYVGYILTSHPNIHFVQRKLSLSISNKHSLEIVQSAHPSLPHETPFYNMGIYGADQIVAVADTGLDYDHCFFTDNNHSGAPTSLNLNRRKVVRIRTAYSGDATDVTAGHGTHVDKAPFSAGDSVTNDDCKTLFGVDTCCDVCNTYDDYAQKFDQFIWSHQDATVLIAQGNDGQLSRFGNLGKVQLLEEELNQIAGGALLLREYFIKKLGISAPSGHLIKAAMIHSSVPLNGSVAYSDDEFQRFSISEAFGTPNFYEGFGKIQLGSLFSDEKGRNVTLSISQESFTKSNQTLRSCYRLKKNVTESSTFRSTLTWYDYSSSTSVLPNIINNLDLIVNVYNLNSETSEYSSSRVLYGNGGSSIDTKNNVERVTVQSIQNVQDPESNIMLSVQVLNSGITGSSQPFTLLSSFVAEYWETLPTEDCLFEVVPQESSNTSTTNSTLSNSTVTDNTTQIFQNSTDTLNSTENLNSTDTLNNTNTDNSTLTNTTTTDNATSVVNSTDLKNSTSFNETEIDNVNATHCYGYADTSRHVCSSNGLCIAENNCSCFDGYYGDNCDFPICFGSYNQTESCSGQGVCIAANSCRCNSGFKGEDCSVITCNGKSEEEGGCTHHGSCVGHVCVCDGNFEGVSCSRCKAGFNGSNCDIPICNGLLSTNKAVCSSRGTCDVGLSLMPECNCTNGYSGLNCEFTSCNNVNSSRPSVCGGRGKCVNFEECTCKGNYDPQQYCERCLPEFAGTHCNHSVCYDNVTCNSHGACNIEAECECFGNWTGSNCDRCKEGFVGADCNIECLASKTCSNRGTCNDEGTCSCNPHTIGDSCNSCEEGWYGNDCNYGIDSNSFGFNSKGHIIYGTIFSTFNQQVACGNVIIDISMLGSNPTCILNGTKSTLQINLGSSPTIVIGDTILLRTYPGSASIVSVNVTQKDYIIVPPVASVKSDKSSIGIGCGTVTFNASASTSSDGRKLTYSWYAISAPSESSRSTLNNLINKSITSSVTFSPDTLIVGTYKAQVKVTSSFSGNYSTAIVSLTVTERALPQLTIKEGVETSFMIGSTAIITPDITFPVCYDASQTVTYVYKLNTTTSADNVVIKQDGQFLVFSDSFTKLTKEGDYYFTLYAAGVSISFKVTAKATPLKVSFNIGDMSQSYEDDVNFIVYLQDPSDSTGTTGSLALTCYEVDTSGSCDGFSSASYKFASSITFNRAMQPGNYYFTAKFSKGTRTMAASLKVKVLNVAKSTVLRVVIVTPSDVSTSVIDPTSDLTLEASSKDTLSSSRTYQWSSSNLVLPSTSNKYLVISKSLLSAGKTYTVNLKITDGSKSGSTSLTFTTNSPPTAGTFAILPSTGVTLVDLFELNCASGWTDVHLPLGYKFMYRKKGSSDDWMVLSALSEKNSISTYMPVGIWQVKALVSDYYGATSESISEVTVTKPQDVASTIESLKIIQQGTVSVSTVSSVLSLIQTTTTQTESQKQALTQSGTTFIQKFFTQIESEETFTSVTPASISSTISVVSSISNSLSYLEDTAVSYGINKFSESMAKVNEKDSIIMKSSDIDSSIKSVDTFKTYISAKVSTRSLNSFSSSDLKTIQTIYNNLVDIKLKTLVADMPAVRVTGVNSYRYARLVSTITLNGLSENVTQSSAQPFTLSSTFSSLSELQGVESVTLSMNSYKMSNTSLLLATKALDFKILVDSTSKNIISSSNIAQLSLERVSGARSAKTGTVLECRVETSSGIFSKASNCTINSSNSNTIVISVKSTGIYLVVSSQDTTPTPATSVNPTTSVPMASNIDYSITYIIIAGSIIGAVILISIISITLLFCILSRLLSRKKRRKDAKKQMELQTIEVTKFQNILRPPSNYSLSYSNNNSPRPANFTSPRY
ncbi:predicted protein [Naegleria gruberi]|uniref:Predicted protein n=1 Tax=Naegleria gruberi TaxID=5762 RepID=D2VG77_NAEGR|nr:uncharacterized protein NAEGRDRAFT_49279 [Naegleria gruberi]EFC44302.1 predicted protein [Naegleria gruberi]|eukprot:XP_002677046.1 predicted protein [Naegleria gruberi strain NEG-M]